MCDIYSRLVVCDYSKIIKFTVNGIKVCLLAFQLCFLGLGR